MRRRRRGSVLVIVLDNGHMTVSVRGARRARATTVRLTTRSRDRLLRTVAATLGRAGIAPAALSAVAVSEGGATYSVMRSVAVIANTIAVATGVPVVALPTGVSDDASIATALRRVRRHPTFVSPKYE